MGGCFSMACQCLCLLFVPDPLRPWAFTEPRSGRPDKRDHGQPQDFGKELQLSIKHISSNLKLSFYSNTWLSTALFIISKKGKACACQVAVLQGATPFLDVLLNICVYKAFLII